MKDMYSYIAVFTFADDGISIEFPDLPGCLPCAQTSDEAMRNAKKALGLHLYGMEQDGDVIPSPTPISKIHTAENEVAVLVSVYMPAIRDKAQTASVKKTLTLPTWLNDLAENEGINFSQALQSVLKSMLLK